MPTLPIDAITINRDTRQRRELKNIESLAASIREIGLINPIVVTNDNILMAGERRLAALHSLGWDNIPVTIFTDLTPADQQLLELEENVKREELPWKDHCEAITRYHRLRQEENDAWTQAQSADALGLTRQHMQERIAVQAAIDSGEELVVNADKYSVARGVVQRKQQRASVEATDVASSLADEIAPGGASQTLSGAEPEGASPKSDEVAASFGFTLQHASFHDWVEATDERGFNFIHCDFPYGVEAGKHHMGAAGKFGGYDDSPDVYWSLLGALEQAVKKGIVGKNAHLMFWYSMDYHTDTIRFLETMGWKVNPFPLVWYKSDNSGILPDAKRGPRRNYETAFLASMGDRNVVQAVSNVCAHPNTKEIHMSEKPREMLMHFFRMFVDGTTKMLDPTMGSANAVRASFDMGAVSSLGLEQMEEFFLAACEANDELLGSVG